MAVRDDPWREPLSDQARERFDEALRDWTATRTPAEGMTALQARGIAAGAVYDVRDLLLDPHLKERGFFWLVDHHPIQQVGRRAWPGAPARLTRTPGRLKRHAPLLGEHNAAVLRDLLGFDRGRYQEMLAAGAAGTVPRAAAVRPSGATGVQPKERDPAATARLSERFGREYGIAPVTVP